MNKSLRVKLGLAVVLIIVWLVLTVMAVRGFDRAMSLLDKQPRNVVMIDAWSFNNGNSREGYEARFVDDETKIEFTSRIDSWEYRSYVRNPVPTKMVAELRKGVLGIEDRGCINYFIWFMAMTSLFGWGMVATAVSLRFERGFAHELRCHFRSSKNGRNK